MPNRPTKNNADVEEEDLPPSKSEIKRQMHALQDLGVALLELNDKQLADMPIMDSQLLDALEEARRISSNSARKRQLQRIGKLMREVDAEPIRIALDRVHQKKQGRNEAFHELEALRDQVLSAGLQGIEKVLERWPEADRQHLRQLVLQHQRELKNEKPPSASRKLFRYLRELQENTDDEPDT